MVRFKSKFVKITKNKRTIEYLNEAIAFDTETTSYKFNDEKLAWVYVWSLAIEDRVIIGRNLSEFSDWIEEMKEVYYLNENRRIAVYVHNLPFDFSFLSGYFDITEVFAIDRNKPIKCLLNGVCELRCSYALTGKSLDTLAKELGMKKLIGDLDYTKTRTSETTLTEKEIGYVKEDVRILRAYIEKKIEEEKTITRIPLTKTGYVRREMRRKCNSKENYTNYRCLMNYLSLSSSEYLLCKRAFMGGFTHANSKYVGEVIENVGANDFTSSYPYVMCSEMFPMSRGFKVEIESIDDFIKLRENYCLIMDIQMEGIMLKHNIPDCPLSFSKCRNIKLPIVNNGRIYQAEYLETSCTDIDLVLFLKTYDIDYIAVTTAYAYVKNYLPKPIIETTLEFYEGKTKLKNVEGSEDEYVRLKENVNSVYGMMVTDIVRENNIYDDSVDGKWKIEEPNLDEEIKKYNKSKNRCTFYPWGIFITAYARRNLWLMILEEGEDYIYSDTDSTKMKNKEKHINYFNQYNKEVEVKLNKMCEYHGIDKSKYKPKDINGKEHCLGVFDDEKPYKYFKTLGAKRYMVEYENGERAITIAGLGKKKGLQFLEKDGKNPFEEFKDGLIVPAEDTGKMCHTYLYKEVELDIEDCYGVISKVHTYGGCHLEPTQFSLGLTDDFLRFLNGQRYVRSDR